MRRSLSLSFSAAAAAAGKKVSGSFYYDAVSPYAYLAFERLHSDAHKGVLDKAEVSFKPVVLGALLQHFGQLGPAEVAGKRQHTYRQASFVAERVVKVPMSFPALHPFNSLALQRLAVACSTDAATGPSPAVVRKILRFVWRDSKEHERADDGDRLKRLIDELKPSRDPNSAAVKDELRAFTTEACEKGIFGVPTLSFDNGAANFWGLDCLEQGMVSSYLANNDPFFTFPQGGWHVPSRISLGIVRSSAGNPAPAAAAAATQGGKNKA